MLISQLPHPASRHRACGAHLGHRPADPLHDQSLGRVIDRGRTLARELAAVQTQDQVHIEAQLQISPAGRSICAEPYLCLNQCVAGGCVNHCNIHHGHTEY